MSELLPADYTYPAAPGFKVAGPSEHAAKAMTGKAAKMREAVLAQIAQYPGGATADEIARDLNLSVLSVRPRVSELYRNGEIEQTGGRRKNESGMTATVWRVRAPRSPSIVSGGE
jgi:predicted ArsR family transcriptional regulator